MCRNFIFTTKAVGNIIKTKGAWHDMTREELKKHIFELLKTGVGTDALTNDCDIIVFLLDNCEIDIPAANRFFVRVNSIGLMDYVKDRRIEPFANLEAREGTFDGIKALAYTGYADFSHTNTDWQTVLSLGIYGLRERILKYRALFGDDKSKVSFYTKLLSVYDAAIRFVKRAADVAKNKGRFEMAEGLNSLVYGAPNNLFEALQTSIIYYNLQHFFDGTFLRTLGRLDSLYYPFYKKERKERAYGLFFDYIKEIDTLEAPSNIPFAISGTDAEGKELTNELSYLILDIYGKAETKNTKFHILCSEKTPRDLIEKAFRLIRNGSNSIVFMSDEKVIESLVKHGAEYRDAVNYHVVGCYECGADGELCSSCNARVNIPKALEAALNSGRDMLTGKLVGLENGGSYATFEDLLVEFERQLAYFCACAMKSTDVYEAHYREIHSSPFLSGTYTSALERGGDLYGEYTAKYNSSSLNAIGLATATDALAAIRRAVWEDKIISLPRLTEILKSNWDGQEYLRQLVKNKYKKFGQGDKSTDDIAVRIVNTLSNAVSGKPNVKGGRWRLGLFSINWRWSFGEKTAASADGRLAGETLSQNTSASFGADKAGATAHLLSVARIDASKTPNGAIADIDLHSSAVSGENGICALTSSLLGYFRLGGLSVHYNVLDTEVLKEARANPRKYPNLQVRLCGWNVLFSSLSDKEKDEFIARSIK